MPNVSISSFTVPANTVGVGLTGYSLTGSNAQSMFDLSGTWNTTGTPTGIKFNVTDTASNAASLLMDLQVGGSSRFKVTKDGAIRLPTVTGSTTSIGISDALGIRIEGDRVVTRVDGTDVSLFTSSQFRLASAMSLVWNLDTALARDAANTLAQRNGVNAQTFNIYNTYTDASNYERGFVRWSSNVLQIGTERVGTGIARDLLLIAPTTVAATLSGGVAFVNASNTTLNLQRQAVTRIQINTSDNIVLTPSTVVAFAGTGASHPALKRNATFLETKLADDSAYAPHAMEYLDITDGITAPASASGRARIYVDTADGDLKVVFGDGTVKTIVTDTP